MSRIAVLDAGGQYCHLIARRIRDLNVSAEVLPIGTPIERLRSFQGVIISGGPASVYDPSSPQLNWNPQDLGVPMMGICYGHQLMAARLGGEVVKGDRQEYGMASLVKISENTILRNVADGSRVWVSHQDKVRALPAGFERLAETPDCTVAAMADVNRKLYGLQFHPEVSHTADGVKILHNFVFDICECTRNWYPEDQISLLVEKIKTAAGNRKVFFFVSGGVDSTVAFTLAVQALGKRAVKGFYVDTGLMRKHETQEVTELFSSLGLDNVEVLHAGDQFLQALSSSTDPEAKRKIIGRLFVAIQDQTIQDLLSSGEWLLGQGTIYPDTIESGSTENSSTIKTHHNRVSEIEKLLQEGRVLEPIVDFYKDEVRKLARKLGIPDRVANRHPFPGPGLAIRCICTKQAGELRELSSRELAEIGLKGWLVPLHSVGVKGDFRSYSELVLLEGRVANAQKLEDISTRLVNTLGNINRVAYLVKTRDPRAALKIVPAKLNKGRLDLLREVDSIANRALRRHPVYQEIWQMPVMLIPLSSGQGETVVLRPVSSVDGMTAEFTKIFLELLNDVADELIATGQIDAVLYDVTNKPPATIEWE